MGEVVMVLGFPASGKSTIAGDYIKRGFVHVNRDAAGGKVIDLVPTMSAALKSGKSVVLDNTFPSAESRKPFIEAAKKAKASITCAWLQSTIEDAQFNACVRMIERRGRLLDPADHKKEKDPNLFPVAVLFAYRKQFQKPEMSEGFTKIDPIKFVRKFKPEFKNKAVIIDYDGTVRQTKSGAKYPLTTDDIQILPNRTRVLKSWAHNGYLLLGASNQSGIAKGELTDEQAQECFDHTHDLLQFPIEYNYCPHNPAPITCYCRKPLPGMGVKFIMEHKLRPSDCIMVGDMTSDRTFASRCGFQYVDQAEFFKK